MICLIAVFVSSRSWRKNCAAKIASTARSKQPSIRLAIFSLDFKIMPYSACRPWFRVQFNDCLSRQCLPSRTGLCIIFFVADTAYFETHRDFVNTERPPSCSLTYELNMMLFHDDASINRRCHANPVDIPLPTGHWIYTILDIRIYSKIHSLQHCIRERMWMLTKKWQPIASPSYKMGKSCRLTTTKHRSTQISKDTQHTYAFTLPHRRPNGVHIHILRCAICTQKLVSRRPTFKIKRDDGLRFVN